MEFSQCINTALIVRSGTLLLWTSICRTSRPTSSTQSK